MESGEHSFDGRNAFSNSRERTGEHGEGSRVNQGRIYAAMTSEQQLMDANCSDHHWNDWNTFQGWTSFRRAQSHLCQARCSFEAFSFSVIASHSIRSYFESPSIICSAFRLMLFEVIGALSFSQQPPATLKLRPLDPLRQIPHSQRQ